MRKVNTHLFILLFLFLTFSAFGQTWKPLEMHGGGKVTGIVFHPSNPNIVYNRTDVAGLNVSVDGGLSWKSLSFGVPKDNPHNFTTRNLAVDPLNPNIMYYTAGNAPSSGNGSSIFRSTDAGVNWTRRSNPTQFSGNGEMRWGDETLVIHPTNTTTLYVGGQPSISGGIWQGNSGFFVSNNSGGSWTEIHGAIFSNAWITAVKFHPADANLVYISAMIETQSGVNTVGKGLWEYNVNTGNLIQLHNEDVVGFDFDANTNKIIVCRSAGINIYDPGAGTWSAIEQPFGSNYGYYLEAHPTISGRWYFGAFDGFNNSGLVETLDGGITYQRSKYTGGSNIQKIDYPEYAETNVKWGHGNSMAGLYFNPLNPNIALMDGIFRTTDAANPMVNAANPNDILNNGNWDWTWVAEGVHIMVTLRVSPHPTDPLRFTINVADVGQYDTYDGGQDMVFPGLLLHYSAALRYAKSNPNIGYVVGEKFDDTGQIRKTTNGGESWFWPMTTNFFEDAKVIQDLQITDANPEHLVVGVQQNGLPSQMYRSTDGAATWTAWDQGITQAGIFKEWESIDRLFKDANDVFYTFKNDKIFRRGWNDANWTPIVSPAGNSTINHMKLDKTVAGKFYITVSSGVIWIWDNGTWSSTPSGTNITELFAISPNGTMAVLEKLWVTGQRTQKLFIKKPGMNWESLTFNGFGGTMKNMIFLDDERLVGTSNGQGANILYLNESSCPTPWGLYAGGIDNQSANIYWQSNESNPFTLSYRVKGTANWTSFSNVNSGHTLSALSPCTLYELRLKSTCPGNNPSDDIFAEFVTKSNYDYCDSYSQSTWRYWIDEVNINADNYFSQWNGGYKDWSCEQSTTILAGVDINITVTPGYLDDIRNVIWYAWIDFNQNGIFEQSERIISTTVGSTLAQNFSIPSPANLSPGLLKMRIVMHRFWTNIDLAACDPYSVGETEDFLIEVLNEDCLLVTNSNDSGDGSLRAAVDCAMPGDTVRFHPAMSGDTIKFTSALININKDLTIMADPADQILIKGQTTGKVLQVNVFKNVELIGLHIFAGSTNNGRALYNLGNCVLSQMNFYENPSKLGIGQMVYNLGNLTIRDDSYIHQ